MGITQCHRNKQILTRGRGLQHRKRWHIKRDSGANRKHHYVLSANGAEMNTENPNHTVRNAAMRMLAEMSAFLLISWAQAGITLRYVHCRYPFFIGVKNVNDTEHPECMLKMWKSKDVVFHRPYSVNYVFFFFSHVFALAASLSLLLNHQLILFSNHSKWD